MGPEWAIVTGALLVLLAGGLGYAAGYRLGLAGVASAEDDRDDWHRAFQGEREMRLELERAIKSWEDENAKLDAARADPDPVSRRLALLRAGRVLPSPGAGPDPGKPDAGRAAGPPPEPGAPSRRVG